jgi:CRISPR-associated protein Cas1
MCTPFLLGLCGEHQVAVSFLKENGRFLARMQGPVNGNVLLRRQQYRLADQPDQRAAIARAVVTAKIANSRVVLLRGRRDRPENPDNSRLEAVAQRLATNLDELKTVAEVDVIRGIEGIAANDYFGVFDLLITANKDSFFFHQRSRRPPLDNTNALLSFLYVLLAHDVESALEAVGLDPAVGFLHCDRPGRAGLALDIMEEFRAYLADRLALSLINRQQVQPQGFTRTESGAVSMDDETRKAVLVAWQKRKQEEIIHPFLQEKVQIGLLPHIQAMLLARFIRGDLEGYPPFFWR